MVVFVSRNIRGNTLACYRLVWTGRRILFRSRRMLPYVILDYTFIFSTPFTICTDEPMQAVYSKGQWFKLIHAYLRVFPCKTSKYNRRPLWDRWGNSHYDLFSNGHRIPYVFFSTPAEGEKVPLSIGIWRAPREIVVGILRNWGLLDSVWARFWGFHE